MPKPIPVYVDFVIIVCVLPMNSCVGSSDLQGDGEEVGASGRWLGYKGC